MATKHTQPEHAKAETKQVEHKPAPAHNTHEQHIAGADHRPASSEQAPAGDPTPPAPLDGWTGNPDPGLPADHTTEAAAEAHKHAHGHKGHVEMHKDGQKIHVHPETVAAHHAAGWREV